LSHYPKNTTAASDDDEHLPPEKVWIRLDDGQRAEALRLLTQIAHKYVEAHLQKRMDDINDIDPGNDK